MSAHPPQIKPRTLIHPDSITQGFLNEAARLESCLQQGREAERRLPFGCLLRAGRKARGISTTILQIFLDPLRFEAWSQALEPVELMYMNPCGIEVVKQKNGRWALYLDGEELLLNLKAEAPYEAARFEINDSLVGGREVSRIK